MFYRQSFFTKFFGPVLFSECHNNIGPCVPIKLNTDFYTDKQVNGIVGEFKPVKIWCGIPLYKYGEKFEGVIRGDRVYDTGK